MTRTKAATLLLGWCRTKESQEPTSGPLETPVNATGRLRRPMSVTDATSLSRYILKLGKAVGGTFGKPLGPARAFDFSLQVFQEVGPGLGMLAFDHGALFRAVIQNALHSISIESDDSVNWRRASPDSICRSLCCVVVSYCLSLLAVHGCQALIAPSGLGNGYRRPSAVLGLR